MTVNQFSKLAFNIRYTIVHGKEFKRAPWIVSALSYYMRYTNDARYLTGDKTTDMAKRSHQRKNNVSFLQMMSPENGSDLKLFGITAIIVLKNIDKEEKLYIRYCREYTFPSVWRSSRSL